MVPDPVEAVDPSTQVDNRDRTRSFVLQRYQRLITDGTGRLASVRPGICKQWPDDAMCEEPCQRAQDHELGNPIHESDPARREQLEPDNAAKPGKITSTQENFPRSDPQHVAARAIGPVQADEMESIPVAIS